MDLADLTRDLEALQAEALAAVDGAAEVASLEALELDVLGKKGRLTGVLRGIGALPAEDRPKVGAIANTVRVAVETALAERGAALRGSELAARLVAETVDVTTPGRPIRRGTLHPRDHPRDVTRRFPSWRRLSAAENFAHAETLPAQHDAVKPVTMAFDQGQCIARRYKRRGVLGSERRARFHPTPAPQKHMIVAKSRRHSGR